MKSYFSLVKFSHTIFALPFAIVGAALGYKYSPLSFDGYLLLKILVCMITARNAAMAFNRYIDRDIDTLNARTVVREIPQNIISPRNALLFVVVNCILFTLTCYSINMTCLLLAPVALSVVLGYSYTKRFTFLCHFVLGIGLGLAPVGAYLAVTNHFDLLPITYGISVLLWVAGFDIIYALQDRQFDENQGLYSVPAKFGIAKAIKISTVAHLLCALTICFAGYLSVLQYQELGALFIMANLSFLALLIYQHKIINENDLSKINIAFFTTNGIASLVFGTLFVLDLIY